MKKTTKRKVQFHSPPPQKRVASCGGKFGEVNKPLLIAIVTLFAVALLVVLLFFSDVFVGKAIKGGTFTTVGQAGIILDEKTVTPGETFTVPITANIGSAKSVAVRFTLNFDTGFFEECKDIPTANVLSEYISAGVDLSVIGPLMTCPTADTVQFEAAWLCADAACSNALSGDITIATVPFTAKQTAGETASEGEFSFTSFEIIDLESGENLVKTFVGDTVTIEPVKLSPECATDVDCAVDQVCENELCVSAADSDSDGIADNIDNCDSLSNPEQFDNDGDGLGDVCDPDEDNDGVPDTTDNCPLLANLDQTDTDSNGLGDVCDADDDGDDIADVFDNCPFVSNDDQTDTDEDGIGDKCEITEVADVDLDDDGVEDTADNCPLDSNLDQTDTDNDGLGDACDVECTTDADCAEGLEVCQDGACVLAEEVPEVSIDVISPAGGVLTTQDALTADQKYTIRITVTPKKILPENHLFIATVSYGDAQKTTFVDTRSMVTVPGSEQVEFTHVVPAGVTGDFTVKAFVWENYPSAGTFASLVKEGEVTYALGK